MRAILDNDHRSFQAPSTWVPLFEIPLTPPLYLTPNSTSVVVDGNTYIPFPIMLDEIRSDGKGEIATVNLVCSNIEGTLSTALKTTGSIDGTSVTFKVYSVELDDIVYEESLEIIKCGPMDEKIINFELGMFNPFTVKLLTQKYLKDFCWNRYKQEGCWLTCSDGAYTAPSSFIVGASDSCTYKLVNCVLHSNTKRFNSFPGIPGGGGFV
jgi:phage-related protein